MIGFLLFALVVSSLGCASLVAGVTQQLADNLTRAALNQNDPETVRDGVVFHRERAR